MYFCALRELVDQARIGIPTIYQIEYVYQHRRFNKPACRKLAQNDYDQIRSILDEYISSQNKYTELPVESF